VAFFNLRSIFQVLHRNNGNTGQVSWATGPKLGILAVMVAVVIFISALIGATIAIVVSISINIFISSLIGAIVAVVSLPIIGQTAAKATMMSGLQRFQGREVRLTVHLFAATFTTEQVNDLHHGPESLHSEEQGVFL
jgi:hypothetical protein